MPPRRRHTTSERSDGDNIDISVPVSDDVEQEEPPSTRPKVSGSRPSTQAASQNATAGPPVSRTDSFLKALRNGEAFTDNQLLTRLIELYEPLPKTEVWKNGESIAEGKEFIIVKLDREDYMHYNRVASVYKKNMYNKFFVPVWASAYDEKNKNGYIMYPRLQTVRQMLDRVISQECDSAFNRREAVRMCLAPIALAIDALHSHVPNKRTMHCHRDICIENMYVSGFEECKNNKDEDQVVYGEAMLKLTRHTRGSFEQGFVNQTTTFDEHNIYHQYFHHPAPYTDGSDMGLYYTIHDWFSFGVYILEVLGLVLNDELNTGDVPNDSTKIPYYIRFSRKLEASLKQHELFTEGSTRMLFTEYIKLARKCIEITHYDDERSMEYTCPDDEKTYYFEYELHPFTAELLHYFKEAPLYPKSIQDIIEERVEPFRHVKNLDDEKPTRTQPDASYTCQACLLRPSVSIPTRAYRRGVPDRPKIWKTRIDVKCNSECNKYYCARCYTNGERLFCPRKHGTTSTIIGHYSSYALILYGEQFAASEHKNLFAKDAQYVANVLMHKMICGIPEDNIFVRPVFSKEKEATQCLEDACKELADRIHKKKIVGSDLQSVSECVNDTNYCIYVYYSGHGIDVDDGVEGLDDGVTSGSWCPTASLAQNGSIKNLQYVKRDDINRHLDNICKCNSSFCEEGRIQVIYIMDHCHPSINKNLPELTMWKEEGRQITLRPDTAVIRPLPGEKAMHDSKGSEITYWFCQLMRSLFNHGCKGGQSCYACQNMKRHIEHECYGVYIDSECLKLHAAHMTEAYGYETVLDSPYFQMCNPRESKLVLAHYNPKGIYYRIFPYKEDFPVIDVDFNMGIDRDCVIKTIIAELKEWDPSSEVLKICLLTTADDDSTKYSLIWDSNMLRDKLGLNSDICDGEPVHPSVLYYHVITRPAEITLCAKDEGTHTETLTLDVDESDLHKLVPEMWRKMETDKLESRAAASNSYPVSQLPNLLVHIIHHWYDKEYKDEVRRQASARATTTTTQRQASAEVDNRPIPDDSSRAVTESIISVQERLRNSFTRHVLADPWEKRICHLVEDDWRNLALGASEYLRAGRKAIFTAKVVRSGYRIEWKNSDGSSSTAVESTLTANKISSPAAETDDDVDIDEI